MSEIRVDTISEKTSANGVAVDSLAIKDGKITNLMNATLSAADLGAGVHIKTGDSGGSAHASADELIVEASGSGGMQILTGNDQLGRLYFGDDGSTHSGFVTYDHANNKLEFGTQASTRAVIDSAGNFGIGTTPESGQGSNSQGLYVGTHASLTSNGAYESVNLSENAYLATASNDTWKYRDTSHAATHEMKAGVHILKVAASGSADAAITWNTGFEVLNDGKARAKNGLLFGTDTAAANVLDDYEEGTYAPTVTCSNSGSYGLSANSDTLQYTKIGRKVSVQGMLAVTSESSPNGNLRLSLPFTAPSLTDDTDYAMHSMTISNNGSTIAGQKTLFVQPGSYAYLFSTDDAGTDSYIDHDEVDTNFQFQCNFTYLVS